MRDLDEGPHRKCHTCGKLQPEPRCLNYNDHWFCGLICKKKQKEKDDANLASPSGRVVRYHER